MGAVLSIRILADAKQAQRELAGVQTTVGRMADVARRAAVPAAAALGALGVGAKGAIDAASDLNEEVSKSQQIFGNQAGAVEAFASRAAKALGQSKQQALAATSTFGIIAQGAGLSGKAATGFSTQFTKLASDLASFNNSTPQEAIDAIGAAMRGEAEPIRRFGVMLDDATLRNQALKMGLISTTKQALTPQQKALAASQAILAQTSKAQGDFARTSGGAANQQRTLAAQTEDLKAKLGQQLLPIYTAMQRKVLAVTGVLAAHQRETKIAIGIVAGLAAAVLLVNGAMSVYAAGQAVAAAATGAFTLAQKAAAAASLGTRIGLAALAVQTAVVRGAMAAWTVVQWALNVAMTANPIGIVIALVAGLIAIVVLIATKTTWFQTLWSKAWGVITGAASAAFGWVKKNWPTILAILTGPIGLAVLAITRNWDKIKVGATAVKDWIAGKFDALVGFVRGLPGRIGSAASGMFDGIKSAFRSAINYVIDKWNGLSFSLPEVDTHIKGIGKIGGFSLSTPDIPRLYSGGIVTSPTLAVVGDNKAGGSGAEAIIPLDKLGGPVDLSDSTIQKLAAAMLAGSAAVSRGVMSDQSRRVIARPAA